MKAKLECLFTSDLHGNESKYKKLFKQITKFTPDAVFIGGDLSRSIKNIKSKNSNNNFFMLFVLPELQKLKDNLKDLYPEIFIISGNDDSKALEVEIRIIEEYGLWYYIQDSHLKWMDYDIHGYSYVPPTPFLFKDWERYDVSRFIPPGSIAPEEGIISFGVKDPEDKYRTIKLDLEKIAKANDLSNSIFLFHSPPYQTQLDRGDLDGKFIDHVPLDVHLGSIAIKDFISKYQPLITMHGHIHESTRLTGNWNDKIGKTICFNGSHDGQELSIIIFDPSDPLSAKRELI